MSAAQNPLTPEPVALQRRTANLAVPERALAIGAHPDDVEFGAGATLAKWTAAGCVVSVLICTDGSKGTWDPTADEAQLVATRQREQRTAASILGGRGEVVFLGYTDGELESGLRQRSQVAAWIRRLRPTVVLGHDPWKRYRLHPDHRHAGLLAVEGVVAARDPKFFPEMGLAHHRPERILLWEADEPDHAEDVTGYADVKFQALAAHESQFESTMFDSALKATSEAQLAEFRRKLDGKLATAGEAAGFQQAEIFKLLDDL